MLNAVEQYFHLRIWCWKVQHIIFLCEFAVSALHIELIQRGNKEKNYVDQHKKFIKTAFNFMHLHKVKRRKRSKLFDLLFKSHSLIFLSVVMIKTKEVFL